MLAPGGIVDAHDLSFGDVPEIDTSDKNGFQIHLKSARGLNIDINAGAPYVKVEIPRGHSHASKPKEKSDSPDFDESLFLACPNPERAKIVVEVLQKHKIASKVIGSAVIDVASLNITREAMKSLKINLQDGDGERKKKKKGAAAGELQMEMKICNQRQAAGARPDKRRGGAKAKIGKMVTVVVVSAKNLNPTDKNGLADPYVKLKCDGQIRKTKHVPKCLEPEFKEQFDMLVTDIDQGLTVEVYDKDIGRDDFMGGKCIQLSNYPLDEGVARDHTIVEKDKDGRLSHDRPAGSVFLQITVSDLMQEPKKLSAEQLKKFPGVLTIMIKKAKGLSSTDRNGYSDPFCVVENGKSRFRTRTIYKQLNPEWNREFTVPVTDVFSSVSLGVYDEDDGGKSIEFLGCIQLRLLQIKDDDYTEKWYALKNKDGTKRAGGDILIAAKFSYRYPSCYGTLLKHLDVSYIHKTEPYKKQILTRNISRITKCINNMLGGIIFVNEVLSYKKSTTVTLIGQVFWTLACVYGELFHVPIVLALLLVLLRVWQRLTGGITKTKLDLVDPSTTDDDYDSEDDDDDDVPEKKETSKPKKKGGGGLFKKIERAKILGEDISSKINDVASILERVKNMVFWHRTEISAIMTLAILVATIVVYILGQYLRYLILLGGYARVIGPLIKYFKTDTVKGAAQRRAAAKKSAPPPVNLIMRVPDDQQLMQYQRLKPREMDPNKRERERLKQQMRQLGQR